MSKLANRQSVIKSNDSNQNKESSITPQTMGGITPQKVEITKGSIDMESVPQQSLNLTPFENLELKLIGAGKINKFVFKPSDVKRLWASNRVKEEIILFLQDLFKPDSQFEQEKVEYNQINILAEYTYYNMIFAKNEMMFDEFKVAVVLDIFWKLLEFDPIEKSSINVQENISSENHNQSALLTIDQSIVGDKYDNQSQSKYKQFPTQPLQHGQQSLKVQNRQSLNTDNIVDEEDDFQLCLKHKVTLFQSLIMKQIYQKIPAININKEEANRLINYAQMNYFKHLRLYEFVFNNKAPSKIKRVTFKQEQAKKSQSLSQALQISYGKEKQQFNDESQLSQIGQMGNEYMMDQLQDYGNESQNERRGKFNQ